MDKINKEIEELQDKLEEAIAKREEVGQSSSEASSELAGIDQWLLENHKIASLTEIIPRAKLAEGELAYITKGAYRKFWHKEPKDVILTKDGKRVNWQYALDNFTQELGLDAKYGCKADDVLRDLIMLAYEYKKKRAKLRYYANADDAEYKDMAKEIEDISVNIGRHEQVVDVQSERSPRSIAIDDAFQAKHIVEFPNVRPWIDKPSRYDIRGVDTKHKVKRHKKPTTSISRF